MCVKGFFNSLSDVSGVYLTALILKLRHSAHLAKSGEAVQDPRQLAVGWDAALTVQMNSLVVQRQSGGCINPGVIENAVIQLAVVNWRGKAVKIRDEQIDIKISRAALRHVDNRQNGAKIIANVNIVVGAHAGEDDGFTHSLIIPLIRREVFYEMPQQKTPQSACPASGASNRLGHA